jgi:L-2-hydroxyglutarate oxidase LhgO
MEHVDCIVVGAGVIGLAVARGLALAGREVIVLEAEHAIGTHTSSRNSEVIHGGIYYPSGSLKAALCVSGRAALYRYCEERGVPHRRCGKLIIAASESQRPDLERLRAQAQRNGVHDLQWLSAAEIRDLEPEVRGAGALLSPSTGIIDSHAYMLALQADAQARGTIVVLRSPVQAGRALEDGIELEVGGESPMTLLAGCVVNSAGLGAQKLAGRIRGVPVHSIPPSHFAKGSYFTLAGRSPFKRLVYPLPEAAGLGVHVTLDMAGRARFGPDVEWVNAIDYGVDPRRAAAFYAAIRSYWPGLADGALMPAYAGIRPKLHAPREPACDFLIQGPADHGVAGLVNLYGIESPGLTASLAIAEHVLGLCGKRPVPTRSPA